MTKKLSFLPVLVAIILALFILGCSTAPIKIEVIEPEPARIGELIPPAIVCYDRIHMLEVIDLIKNEPSVQLGINIVIEDYFY